MTLFASDPLALVALQGGLIQAPQRDEAAQGDTKLDAAQRSASLGEPIPVVFCRRDEAGGTGGVLVSPAATEARFTNTSSNAVTASYHLVVSEGQIGSIQVRDVLQGACRRGSHTQTYNRRAGTWTPGNFLTDQSTVQRRFFSMNSAVLDTQEKINQYNQIIESEITDPAQLLLYPFTFLAPWYEATLTNPAAPNEFASWFYDYGLGVSAAHDSIRQIKDVAAVDRPLPAASFYCGSIGVYTGLSTVSFTVTTAPEIDIWKQQVNLFIRNGIQVPRLIEGTTGSSRNYADLVQWALVNAGEQPSSLIDSTALLAAATFLDVNGFHCDLEITESSSLPDFLAKLAPGFLLAETRNNGAYGLRPLLPTNPNGTIKTTALAAAATFTEDDIQPGGMEITYVPLADRTPFAVQVQWRQQTEAIPIIRTAEVRYPNEAEYGPFEQQDLSRFCTREAHAVKVGAFIRSRRRWISHSARVRLRQLTTALVPGDLVRVTLTRAATGSDAMVHDYLYEVQRIAQSVEGEASIDLIHCPVDAQGRSLVALEVAAATGSGIVLPATRTGEACDVNSSGDTTVPAEAFTQGTAADQWVLISPELKEAPPAAPAFDPSRSAGIYFHSVEWSGLTLVVSVRVAPTGRAAATGLGPLMATIQSGTVVALDAAGTVISPQPGSLPSIGATTGEIVDEWSTYDESSSLPVPPLDRIFEGQFRIPFTSNDLPAAGVQYRMPITITGTSGGFDDVQILNSGIAYFDFTIPDDPTAAVGDLPHITYSQSSLVTGLQAASVASMQNGTWIDTLQTSTSWTDTAGSWIRVDIGAVRQIVGIVVGAQQQASPGSNVPPPGDRFDPNLFESSPFVYNFPLFNDPDAEIQASNDGSTWWKVCSIVGRDETDTVIFPWPPGGRMLHEYTAGKPALQSREFYAYPYDPGLILDGEWPVLFEAELAYAPRIPADLKARYIRVWKLTGPLSVTEFYVKVRTV